MCALGVPAASEAQPAKKLWRVAYLTNISEQVNRPWIAAFRDGLRELGYVEGKNILIEYRYAAGRLERIPGYATELARIKPDIFVVFGAEAARAADKAGGSVPVVFANHQNPVASGFVASLGRPGGNFTGLSDFHGASITKRLELMKETVGSATRVAVLWRRGNDAHPPQLKDLEAAAAALRLSVLSLPVKSAEEIDDAFRAMKSEGADAVLLLGDPVLTTNQARIANLALKNRLPAMYTLREFAQAGGLISYGTDFADLYRRAATYVDKIFKGARPADLPVEQATKFDLVVNLKTAKALGIKIPRSILLRADQVIE